MVDRAPRNRVARWMEQTGQRLQESRRRRAAQRGQKRRGGPRPSPRVRGKLIRVLAWGVHAYTALGLVCAAGITVLLFRGGPNAYRGSFLLMVLATLIDATDGTLARKVRVKEVLPQFDGRRLDDIIDFLTYTFLPLLLVWRAGVLPESWAPWLLVPLMASIYGFCQTSIKTDDGYFLGFPSLWNVVALYVFVLPFGAPVALAILVGLGILTFVPSRYLYASSRKSVLNTVSNLLSAVWCLLLFAVLMRMPAGGPAEVQADTTTMTLAWVSFFYPVYYLAASWIITIRLWASRGRTRERERVTQEAP